MATEKKTERPYGFVQALIPIVPTLAIAEGVAWAAGQGGTRFLGAPVMVWCALLAFAIQWLIFVPSYLKRTEHFYDLTGSVTYLVVILFALWVTGAFDPRSLLLTGLVAVWAIRLGSFLFRRVRRDGRDGRFDQIKTNPASFLVAWTLQGLWVFLTLSAALAAITAGSEIPLGWLDFLGLGVWIVGFAIEVIADRQKSAFRAQAENKGRFIDRGLWSWSRHPNYFGEIVLWTGIAIAASSTFEGWRWIAWISPVFVVVLLTKISGIPMLERRGDKRWGDDPEYRAYKKRTSVLVPLPPGN